jgi:hypothetical protein
MSFGSGDARKRPGIFDSFRAAMTPAELPPDDGKPISPPKGVLAATVMAMIAGLVFVLIGGVSLATTDDQLNSAVTAYNRAIADCTTQFGGIGDSVVVPAGASSDVTAQGEACKAYRPLTDETISAAKTQNVMISVIIVVIGLIALAGGWFLRAGAKWSRLTVVGAVIISVVVTMLFQVSNIFTLVATLLLVVAVMLCYIGRGSVYFARLKARRAG